MISILTTIELEPTFIILPDGVMWKLVSAPNSSIEASLGECVAAEGVVKGIFEVVVPR